VPKLLPDFFIDHVRKLIYLLSLIGSSGKSTSVAKPSAMLRRNLCKTELEDGAFYTINNKLLLKKLSKWGVPFRDAARIFM